jgi:regulator of protease activity HflC (stomatin/prohibitin superfamily)
MNREQVSNVPSGYLMLVVLAVVQISLGYVNLKMIMAGNVSGMIVVGIVSLVVVIGWVGFFMVHPNEAKVLQLFGKYGEGTAPRSHPAEIAQALREEIQDRLEQAGVTVIEARISHLAYAPEIANAMLRRQQASAIIAARTQIVAGAVGMVEMALDQLKEKNVVELDEERKAAMVSNLLVVLCGEESTKPIVNAGSLYN